MPTVAPRSLWQAVLGELQVQMARPSFETFLRDTTAVAWENNRLTVNTSSPFVAEYLQQKLYPLVKRTAERVAKEPMEVTFQVVASEPPADVMPTVHVQETPRQSGQYASLAL